MKRILAALLLFALSTLAMAGLATAVSADNPHLRSAFTFAHRKMWPEAVQEAKSAGSPVLAKYFLWLSLKDPESDATFDAITGFIEDNPDWPDQAVLLKHAEVALLSNNPSDAELSDWFSKHPPQTGMARMRSAPSKEALAVLIRAAWVTDDYDKKSEAAMLDKYHGILRPEDHIKRVDRLLWEGKTDDAKHLLKYVPYDYQRLFAARLALAQDKQNAPIEVVNVSPSLRGDAGLLYQRMLWRARRGDKEGVREMLLAAPADVHYPEKWWLARDRQIREAIGEGNIRLATQLLANHGQKTDGLQYREVQWLSGWIGLEYLHQPAKALPHFSWAYKESVTPAGKGRAAYWAGRACEASRACDASDWYDKAAHYPTTFYGQLASSESGRSFKITANDRLSREDRQQFRKKELVQLVLVLAAAQETDAAGKFIFYLEENADSEDEAILATQLGRDIGRIDYSVRAAKKALQRDILSLEVGWPIIQAKQAQGLETALVLGLSRQESEFNADAVSPSGAIGLMQLLPGTAKEIARKNDIRYNVDRLYDGDYNITIGSLYFRKLLDHFNGSYVLAIASYNAGPGRVGEWLDMYGRPGNDARAVVDWVERIPTYETRNYVQHVLENVQVYRYMLGGKSITRPNISKDLVR